MVVGGTGGGVAARGATVVVVVVVSGAPTSPASEPVNNVDLTANAPRAMPATASGIQLRGDRLRPGRGDPGGASGGSGRMLSDDSHVSMGIIVGVWGRNRVPGGSPGSHYA